MAVLAELLNFPPRFGTEPFTGWQQESPFFPFRKAFWENGVQRIPGNSRRASATMHVVASASADVTATATAASNGTPDLRLQSFSRFKSTPLLKRIRQAS